ncbi:ras-related protein Rab-21-like [Battus philenor]|uniref:ras-related protein Rab-21-like n=1 Tax=Battus philenor TaxID=42288 RepID=UPI0035CF7881
MAKTETHNFKVVLLGEGCVGKTSLLLRYIENKFNDKHLTTLQATFLNKKLNIDGKRINLSIWDTAGQERFHALGPIYYRNANGAILVYDITDKDSFEKVKTWVKELKTMLGSDIVIAIAGNKIDLEEERRVPILEAERLARIVGANHQNTSAKNNEGVEDLFLDLIKDMLVKCEQNTVPEVASTTPRVIVVDDEPEPKKSCCTGRARIFF